MEARQYPLLFKYRDPFIGNGFIAGIEIRGRALMTIRESGDDVWIDGVWPDCISEGGRSEREAASSFREDYRAVVFDIMAEANTFADFKSRIESVFKGADPITTAEWDRAVELVRKEKLSLDWLEKVPAESFDFGMDIIELKDPKASDNHLPELQQAA